MALGFISTTKDFSLSGTFCTVNKLAKPILLALSCAFKQVAIKRKKAINKMGLMCK
jgi:hypothetical protein